MIPEARARAVYQVLVREAGADPSPDSEEMFVHHVASGNCLEYRFGGHLGFGGKYWPGDNKVNCYQEDLTPERDEILDRINDALTGVYRP